MRKTTALDKFKDFSFALPAIIIFSIFYIYPFFYSFILSFHKYDLLNPMEFVGLKNFITIMHNKDWWISIYNAGFITFWAVTFQNLLALSLALAVDKVFRLNKFYRVVFFLLPVLSEVIIGILMRQMLAAESAGGGGVFNQILHNIGLGSLASDWLGVNSVRLVTALVHCWKGFGWAFVIFFAGLQTIPEQLYEAARIDGANGRQTFFKVTLPLLMPVVSLILVLTILGTMQAFAMILALTRGAVEVPVFIIYNHVMSRPGQACAEGIILGLILVTVSFTMFFVGKKIREKYGVLPS